MRPTVGDVIDEQHAPPVEIRDVQRGRQHLRGIQDRADSGVELDVDRSAVLHAERVRDGAGGQQAATGDRDDHLGDESVPQDRPGELSRSLAELVPREPLPLFAASTIPAAFPFAFVARSQRRAAVNPSRRAPAAGRARADAAPTARRAAS